ncbi:hypothetical protein AV530_007145 [Patagioenas fasciata monilis]|uniref:Uncharacterized protein n=1 Tax=Patagioenas fasciata monilis TaxID=372326 RepID=A0A1V4K9V9_PATFA|nr:hypothetical protein AV530_007145 [Patagioenas fasciata monilis]
MGAMGKILHLEDSLQSSTVIVEKTVQDLMNLMHDLSAYSDQFLNMVCVKLQEYKDTCTLAYRWRKIWNGDQWYNGESWFPSDFVHITLWFRLFKRR